MRRLRSAAPLLGVGVVLVLTGSASADRVAALTPQVRPPAAPEVRDRFHEAVTRGLQAGGGEVIPAGEVRLRLGASDELLNCAGAGACAARAAQALRADHLVATEVDATGKDYTIKVRLLDPVGREVAKVDDACDICTVKEAEDAIARAAGKLATAPRTQPSETTPPAPPPPPVATTPPAPPKAEPTPPPKAEPTTPPAEATHPETAPAPAPNHKGFPWRPVAISSLAVGLVGVVVGIPLLAIDGQPTCNLPNPKQSCPEVYNTVGGGATLLTFGLAGVAASGVLFYLDHRARKRAAHPTVMLTPLQGGAFVSAGGRF